MSNRRIILLLDGTWNDADLGNFDTNIVRLREVIARSLDRGVTKAGIEHVVFYERGVGTGTLLNRVLGGALGEGGTTIELRRTIACPGC